MPMTPPPDSPDSAAPEDAELSGMLSTLTEKGLAKYLRDSELAKQLAREVAEELNIGPGWVTLAFELLAPLIEDQVKEATGWIGRTAGDALQAKLKKLPFYNRLTDSIATRLARLDKERLGEREFVRVIAGHLTPDEVRAANALSLDLQAHLQQLRNDRALSAQMAEALDGIRALLNPQPPLMLRLVERTQDARFVFGARAVDFLGRTDESAALDRFLEDSRKFCWWLIAGPGGQGKSRLALEFCLWRGVLWRAGFLADPLDTAFWHNWKPERPTLLVCDYAGARPDKIRDIAVALYERQHGLEFPVRLLLLERDADADALWRQKFDPGGTDGAAVRQSQHAASLTLRGLDDDELWHVIENLCGQANKPLPKRTETLGSLAAIDPDRRPLFAHFLADAIAAGRSHRGWDREALLRDVLRREEQRYWEPAEVTEKDKNLLALATMTGGLPVAVALGVDAGNLLPDAQSFDPTRHEAMTGRPAEQTLAPLEPDILGEFFVLTHLRPRHSADGRLDLLREIAWHIDVAMGDFIARLAQDYANDQALASFIRIPSTGDIQRFSWSCTAINICGHLASQHILDVIPFLYDELQIYIHDNSFNVYIAGNIASFATNWLFGALEIDDTKQATTIFNKLEQINNIYFSLEPCFSSRIIHVQLAKSMSKLIQFYAQKDCIDLICDIYDRCRPFYQDDLFPPAEEAKKYIISSVDDIIAAININDSLKDISQLINDAHIMWSSCHKTRYQARSYSNFCANIIAVFGKRKLIPETVNSYNIICDVYKHNSYDDYVSVSMARGHQNLIVAMLSSGQINSAMSILETFFVFAKQKQNRDINDIYRLISDQLSFFFLKMGDIHLSISLRQRASTLT